MTREKHAGIGRGRLAWVARIMSILSIRPAIASLRPRTAVVVASLLAQSQRKLLIAPRHAGRRKGKNND